MTSVYVAVDRRGEPIYIGVTGCGVKRFHEHAASRIWWPYVHHLRVFHLPSRDVALDIEAFLINQLAPEWNGDFPRRDLDHGRQHAIQHGIWPDGDRL